MKSALRMPARLAVTAVLLAAQGACGGGDAPDASRDATVEAATCDAATPDGRVCETVCLTEVGSNVEPLPCELFCEHAEAGYVGPCYQPDGGLALDCNLYYPPDSPEQVLC